MPIHAIHTSTDNTDQYMQYRPIHAIHSNTNKYIPILNTGRYMQYIPIHAIQANTCKYMQNTCKIHADTYQYKAVTDHGFTFGHECIGSVFACICLYLACIQKNNTY